MSARRTGTRPVEITPAMIEAGISVLRRYEYYFDFSPTFEEDLVQEILEAALVDLREDGAEKPKCLIKADRQR
jgi:hypothetical protein